MFIMLMKFKALMFMVLMELRLFRDRREAISYNFFYYRQNILKLSKVPPSPGPSWLLNTSGITRG